MQEHQVATIYAYYLYSVYFLRYYFAEYEHTIRPTIWAEYNANRIFSTTLLVKHIITISSRKKLARKQSTMVIRLHFSLVVERYRSSNFEAALRVHPRILI